MGLLDGKVVIVTGAGGGIGRAHARLLASEGAKIVVNDLGGARDGSAGEGSAADKVVDEIRAAGGSAVANHESVASAEGAAALVKAAVSAFGHVDVLVNNAGILRDKSFLKMDEAMWDSVVAVHLKGTFLCSQVFARQLVAQGSGGRIVNTTSVSGMLGNFGQANYSSAKAGIYGLTRTMSIELQKHRITVNAIAPIAKTRMTEDLPMFQGVDTLTAGAHRAGRAVSRERPVRRSHGARARDRRRARVRLQGRRDDGPLQGGGQRRVDGAGDRRELGRDRQGLTRLVA